MVQSIISTLEPTDLKELVKDAVRESLTPFMAQISEPRKEESTFLTRLQVCKKLNISLGTLHSKTKEGQIVSHRIGRRVLYKPEDVNAAITKRVFRAMEGQTS